MERFREQHRISAASEARPMLTALFFLLTFATIATLIWAAIELFQVQEDPLADRLQELQSSALVSSARTIRRSGQGGFLNWILYMVSIVPGGEDWLSETEKELNQAGLRNRQVVAAYVLFNVVFMSLLLAGAIWLQREKSLVQMLIGLIAPMI